MTWKLLEVKYLRPGTIFMYDDTIYSILAYSAPSNLVQLLLTNVEAITTHGQTAQYFPYTTPCRELVLSGNKEVWAWC